LGYISQTTFIQSNTNRFVRLSECGLFNSDKWLDSYKDLNFSLCFEEVWGLTCLNTLTDKENNISSKNNLLY